MFLRDKAISNSGHVPLLLELQIPQQTAEGILLVRVCLHRISAHFEEQFLKWHLAVEPAGNG